MNETTAAKVKEVRVRAGCGMMETKRLLEYAEGDVSIAVEIYPLMSLAVAVRNTKTDEPTSLCELRAKELITEKKQREALFRVDIMQTINVAAVARQIDYLGYKVLSRKFKPRLANELAEATDIAKTAVAELGEVKCKDCNEGNYQQYTALKRRLEKLGVEL